MIDTRHCRRVVVFAILGATVVVAVLSGCSNEGGGPADGQPKAPAAPAPPPGEILRIVQEHAALRIIYPLDESVFPPEISAPTFRWEDPRAEADTWEIRFEFADGGQPLSFRSTAAKWRPEPAAWETIKQRSVEQAATVGIFGAHSARPETILSAAAIRLGTSKDEVGAPIFYRQVNLPFAEAVKDPSNIKWRFGGLGSKESPPVVLENLPTCANCHSFTADGSILAMEVDSANDKGSYTISPVERETVFGQSNIITWSDYAREDGELTFGMLPRISPSGDRVICTVKDRSVFVDRPDLAFSQLFFPVKGILVYYDRAAKTFHALPGGDDPDYVQANPVWSPDGKTIVFAKSKARELNLVEKRGGILLQRPEEVAEFLDGRTQFRYDLYRIPFGDGKGGVAEPIVGASNNGKSNYFPKFSPDGKWIVFCRAESFMLLQPDSALFIIPAEGGEARRMRCNTGRMNSWHSWSPNGKWLVFSSKQFSPYTELFLTHVDEHGESTPPVVLEDFSSPDRAANLPEFVDTRPDAIHRIRQEFVDDGSFVRAGFVAYQDNDFDVAQRHYRSALKLNPENIEAHANLGVILMQKGLLDEAEPHLMEAAKRKPDDAGYQRNLGDLRVRQNRTEEGMDHYCAALRIDPTYIEARVNLGLLLLMADKTEEGAAEFAEAVRQTPDDPTVHYQYARALKRLDNLDEAVAQLRLAVKLDPDYAVALVDLATILAAGEDRQLRNGAEAVELARRACVLTRYQDPRTLDLLAAACAENGQYSEAVRFAREAQQLARSAGGADFARQIDVRLSYYLRGEALPAKP